jgi:hypothetical protein
MSVQLLLFYTGGRQYSGRELTAMLLSLASWR